MKDEDGRVRRAAKMLLNGATLLGQPCPYCSGVRVLKDGYALCVSCGQEPERTEAPDAAPSTGARGADHPRPGEAGQDPGRVADMLEEKLVALSEELASETDREKEIKILDSMEAVLSALQKARRD